MIDVFFFFSSKTQELFTLTYGAFVAQILNDYEHVDEVNKQLDKMYVCSGDVLHSNSSSILVDTTWVCDWSMIFLLAILMSIGAMTFGKPPRFFPKYEQPRSSRQLVLFWFSARFQDVSGHYTVDYQLVTSRWWVLVVTRRKSIDGIRRITRRSRTEAELQSDDLWRHSWCSGNGPCLSFFHFFESVESACLDSTGSGMSFRARSTKRRQCDWTSSEIHQETGRCHACWRRLTMLGLLLF